MKFVVKHSNVNYEGYFFIDYFSEVWTCTLCSADEEVKIRSPIPREFEVTSSGKRKAPNGLVDKEIKVTLKMIL